MSISATFEKCDPATGEVIGQYQNFSREEVFACVHAAQPCKCSLGKSFGFTARKKTLLKWASFITKNQKEIAQLVASRVRQANRECLLRSFGYH